LFSPLALNYQTQFRFGPWIFGMILAYAMNECKLQLTKQQAKIGWFIWLTIFCILTVMKYLVPNVHIILSKFIWNSFICWIIFAFQRSKTGERFQELLSHRYFLPLSRLGLGIYMTHRTYMSMTLANMKQPQYFDVSLQIHVTLADFIFSTIFAVILYLVVEVPVTSIAKHFEKQ
jgi:peptidoglycan/LPS O-acetylase OafA/YrhL